MGREEAAVMVDMNSNREFEVTAEQLQRLSEVKAEEVRRLVEELGGLTITLEPRASRWSPLTP